MDSFDPLGYSLIFSSIHIAIILGVLVLYVQFENHIGSSSIMERAQRMQLGASNKFDDGMS